MKNPFKRCKCKFHKTSEGLSVLAYGLGSGIRVHRIKEKCFKCGKEKVFSTSLNVPTSHLKNDSFWIEDKNN